MSATPKLNLRLMEDSDIFAGETINAIVSDIDDKVLGISHEKSKVHFEPWMKNTDYQVDDLVRVDGIPSWGVWVCITPGTSGSTPPNGSVEDMTFNDGTVVWKLRKIVNEGVTIHNKLNGRSVNDAHPISAITGLQTLLDTLITAVDAKAYTDTKIADLIAGAPSTLDTLKEIADALAADDNAISALTTLIDTKVDKVAGKGLSTNDYDNTAKAKVDKVSEDANGKLIYNGKLVYEDVRIVVFVGGSSELIYPFNGVVQEIAVVCSEPQSADLSFNVETQTKANYKAKANSWNLVGGSSLTLIANAAYQEYTNLSNTNLTISAGDVIRASTAGDDTGVVFHVIIKNN